LERGVLIRMRHCRGNFVAVHCGLRKSQTFIAPYQFFLIFFPKTLYFSTNDDSSRQIYAPRL
jgi:hypothetical protein